jgi:hypothetical protein
MVERRGLAMLCSLDSSLATAAVTSDGADAIDDAIGNAEGRGVGGTVGSRGALLIGNG